jgi:hypothetical protein
LQSAPPFAASPQAGCGWRCRLIAEFYASFMAAKTRAQLRKQGSFAMNRGLATGLALSLALVAGATAAQRASAQGGVPAQAAPQCNDFLKLRANAQQKALLVKTAGEHKGDRKGMCTALQVFSLAEEAALKFLESNMVWCGIPEQVIAEAKANHEKTVKFRDNVCNAPPGPKPPTLSDAISTPSVDTGKNTKTGEGTFDTLMGNPLAK